ncbi:MAG: hypothetical protein ACFE0O_03790 [Opitutales bacterium]
MLTLPVHGQGEERRIFHPFEHAAGVSITTGGELKQILGIPTIWPMPIGLHAATNGRKLAAEDTWPVAWKRTVTFDVSSVTERTGREVIGLLDAWGNQYAAASIGPTGKGELTLLVGHRAANYSSRLGLQTRLFVTIFDPDTEYVHVLESQPVIDLAESFREIRSLSTSWGIVVASVDRDNDGLTDYEEVQQGTDPLDGFSDLFGEYDYDGDGIINMDEEQNGTDPRDQFDPNEPADNDQDGFANVHEAAMNTDPEDPLDPFVGRRDWDRDSMPDEAEVSLGTDLMDPSEPSLESDSDGDGWPDALEAWLGSSPANALDPLAAMAWADRGLGEARTFTGDRRTTITVDDSLIGPYSLSPDDAPWVQLPDLGAAYLWASGDSRLWAFMERWDSWTYLDAWPWLFRARQGDWVWLGDRPWIYLAGERRWVLPGSGDS